MSADQCPLMSKNECSQMIRDVSEIKRAIIGNEEFKEKGLVERVVSLEVYRDNDKIRWAKIAGATAVISFIVTIIVTIAEKHLFK